MEDSGSSRRAVAHTRRTFLRAALAAPATLLTGACGPAAQPGSPSPTGASWTTASSTAGQSEGVAAARAGPPALNPPVRVKAGTLGLAPEAGLYLALDLGYFADEGLAVELEHFRTGEQLPALAVGQLHVGHLAPNPSTFTAVARGIGVRIVAPCAVITERSAGSGLIMRQDHISTGRYRSPADLRGMNVAAPGQGGSIQLYLERCLALGGLSWAEVTTTHLQFPDMLTALANQRVDAAWAVEPFITLGAQRDTAALVIRDGQVAAGDIPLVLALSPAFTEHQPEAAQRFVAAWLRGQRDHWRAFDRGEGGTDQVIRSLITHTPIKDPALYAAMAANGALGGVVPNGELDVDALNRVQDYFLRVGSQTQWVDLSHVIDRTYVEYAVQRLGRLH